MSETTVLIADDHPLFRAALTQAVEQNLDGVRIHQAENMGQLETLAAEQQDADLVRLAQLGSEQPSYEPGPYSSFTEPHVEAFCDWYIMRLEDHFATTKAGIAAE